MGTLEEQFAEAARGAEQRRNAPPHVQASASMQRLDELYAAATSGDPAGREAAMRHYIELVGDLGQQDG